MSTEATRGNHHLNRLRLAVVNRWRVPGLGGSTGVRMTAGVRMGYYGARFDQLTPRQRRRVLHKARHDLYGVDIEGMTQHADRD